MLKAGKIIPTSGIKIEGKYAAAIIILLSILKILTLLNK